MDKSCAALKQFQIQTLSWQKVEKKNIIQTEPKKSCLDVTPLLLDIASALINWGPFNPGRFSYQLEKSQWPVLYSGGMWDLYKNRKDRLLQMKTCCLVVVKLLIKDNYCYIVLIEIHVSTDYITGRNVYNNIFLYEHPWSVLKTDQSGQSQCSLHSLDCDKW